MGDALTLTVQGEGGGRWEMDVPAAGSHARELFDQKVANGQLLVVDGDEMLSPAAAAELLAAEGGSAPADLRKVRGEAAAAPPPVEPPAAEEPPKVGAGSSRDAWAAYAATKGVEVDGMNRAEIIAALEAQGTPPAEP